MTVVDFQGRTAFVTGAGRGQGRSHAVALARAGANVVLSDIGRELQTIPYAMSSPEDLKETQRLVEEVGGRSIAAVADARDGEAMRGLAAQAVAEFGTIDVAVINHGVCHTAPPWEVTDEEWNETISVNLTGVWQAAKAVMPTMIANGRGSIVLTSSVNGFYSYGNMPHYAASKHGVLGLMRSFAVDLGPHGIRVNAVCPTTVPTTMVTPSFAHFAPAGTVDPGFADIAPAFHRFHLLDIPWVETDDISAAVLWLASDEARYITGVALPVDGGANAVPPAYPLGKGLETG